MILLTFLDTFMGVLCYADASQLRCLYLGARSNQPPLWITFSITCVVLKGSVLGEGWLCLARLVKYAQVMHF